MNRETYPASFSPIVGDVIVNPGERQATVAAIQHVPVSDATPNDHDLLEFNATTGEWEPGAGASTAFIYINGVAVSDDPTIYINAGNLTEINGV